MLVAQTERLVLRRWRDDDAEPLAAINADPEVTRYLGGPMTREASDALLARLAGRWGEHGYGRAAVERRSDGRLLGFCGLGPHPAAEGEVEIGWRLARDVWGNGYATEAATAMRDLAFTAYGLARIVSVAVPENAASVAVMRRIGMRHWRDMTYDGLFLTVYAQEAS